MVDPLENNSRIINLISHFALNELSEPEEAELRAWLEADAANKVLFDKILRPESLAGKFEAYQALDTYKELELLKARLARMKQVNGPAGQKRQAKTVRLRQWLAYAAVLIVFAGIVSYFFFIANEHTNPEPGLAEAHIKPGKNQARLIVGNQQVYDLTPDSIIDFKESGIEVRNSSNQLSYVDETGEKHGSEGEEHTLVIPRGGNYFLQLADGTKVWLNAETKLTYPVRFNNSERRIRLISGEVYLEVTHDVAHPFILETSRGTITVLGTSFNVRDYTDEHAVVATLVTGRINMRVGAKAGDVYTIIPNQQLIVSTDAGTDSQKVVVQDVYAPDFTGWKNNYFEFHNQTLAYIIRDISRWYDCSYVFSDDSLMQYRFSVKLDKYSRIEDLLQTIELTKKVKLEVQDQKIVIGK